MIDAKEWLEFAEKFQGHKCPALAMGLRVGAAALNKLNVERAKDDELLLHVDVGENHWAMEYVDGLQVITGCTTGKGNLIITHKGKWSVVLTDLEKNKAVRVTPKPEIILSFRKTDFFKNYRRKGIRASLAPDEVVEPVINLVMNSPEERLLIISDVYDYNHTQPHLSFNSFVCEECDEVVIEEYGRIKDGKMICIDCANNHRSED